MITTRRILCFCLAVLTVFSMWGCSASPSEETAPIATEAIVETTVSTEPIVDETEVAAEVTEAVPEETLPVAPNGEPILATFHVAIDSLNVRSAPNLSSRILDCLQKGEEVKILDSAGDNNQWVKIYFTKYNGKECVGYCFNNRNHFKEGLFDKNTLTNLELDTSDNESAQVGNSTDEETQDCESKPVEETKPQEETVETKPVESTEPPATETYVTEPPVTEPVVPETTESTTPATEETVPDVTEKPEPTPQDLAMENHGTYGRLIIPSADISCQLNSIDLNSSEASYLAQYYTDAEDSAAFFIHKKTYVISDHSYQAFATLTDIRRDDTAYIGSKDGVKKYYCYKTCYGRNDSGKLTTSSGTNATTYDGLIMYTFSDKEPGCDIYITFWREKTW